VGQDIDSHLFRQLRDSQTLHAPDYMPFFPRSYYHPRVLLSAEIETHSVTDETLCLLDIPFERGRSGRTEGEGGVDYEIFSPQTRSLHSTLSLRHREIRPNTTPYQRFPCGKKKSVPIGFAGGKKTVFSSSPFAVLLLCRLSPPMTGQFSFTIKQIAHPQLHERSVANETISVLCAGAFRLPILPQPSSPLA
jgi:hypothetical protein